MKIYALKLCLIGILFALVDHMSTWYVVNYLDIGVYEGNINFRDQSGKLDMEASNIALLAIISVYIILVLLLLKKDVFPKFRAYTTLEEVEKSHKRFAIILFLLIAAILNQGSVVFFWNPLVDLDFISTKHIDWYKRASLIFCTLATAYWALIIMWRYLTPKAQNSHRYRKFLQWPYNLGIMDDAL